MPPHKVLYLCSGSQGEPRAALNRISNHAMKHVTIDEGDVVIFSSRVIPGNEKSINHIKNKLTRLGVKIITRHELDLHVSGHPGRSELKQMYEWVRPKILIPVHGELQHMVEQARFGKQQGIAEVVVPENGTLIDLSEGEAGVIDEVPSGRLALDGDFLLTLDHAVIKERRNLEANGVAAVSIILDSKLRLKNVQCSFRGFVTQGDLTNDIYDKVEEAYHALPKSALEDDGKIQEEIRISLRRLIYQASGKRPVVMTHVVRL